MAELWSFEALAGGVTGFLIVTAFRYGIPAALKRCFRQQPRKDAESQ